MRSSHRMTLVGQMMGPGLLMPRAHLGRGLNLGGPPQKAGLFRKVCEKGFWLWAPFRMPSVVPVLLSQTRAQPALPPQFSNSQHACVSVPRV
jgi:hypothetical protein